MRSILHIFNHLLGILAVFQTIPILEADQMVPEQVDNFESNKIAPFWLPGAYGSGLYAPGAITISTNFARTGKSSVGVTVRAGDMSSPGSDGLVTERADLDSGHYPLINQDVWYGFSVLFPKDFPW